MKNNRLLIITLSLMLVMLNVTAVAAPVYSYKENIPISNSITLTKVKEFHSGKNISYSYIKADLSDQNTSLELLTSGSGTDIVDTVGNLAATNENTVAALNADFFSVYSGNKGFATGMEIKDGAILQSAIDPQKMATIAYLNDSLSMAYYNMNISVTAPTGVTQSVLHLNKHTSYFGDVLMYTSQWGGGMSPAPGGVVVEVVVSGGKVVEFRRNMPPVKIPEDGCVFVVSEGSTMFFANNFNVGDDIVIDIQISPELEGAKHVFGGGAMLVSDGALVSEYSHVISGKNPRSAIGVDESGKTVYLVAVNGRQEESSGMTMSELAQLMLSLGCHNAVNLDGGGSTNMVASTVWNKSMHSVNSPTENRKVINAVGITYHDEITEGEQAPSPSGILLDADKKTVFVGHPVKITAALHDENLRPATGQVQVYSNGGTVENGVFMPTVQGNVTVEASYGDISADLELYVVDKVSGIDAPGHVRLNPGQTAPLDISVFDDAGHYVEIEDVSRFEISSSDAAVASVENNTIKAHSNGTAVITISKDGAAARVSVAVGEEEKAFNQGFESEAGSFTGYPDYAGGAFEISDERAYSGSSSGKLSYDFTAETETDAAMGAYFTLKNRVTVAETEDTISLKLYTENEFLHEMRAQFTDANGKLAIVSFGESYEKGSWQTLTANIPATFARPLKLDSIYALYTPGDEKDSGAVYIDDLAFSTAKPILFEAAQANSYEAVPVGDAVYGSFSVGSLVKRGNGTLLFNNWVTPRLKKAVATSDYSALLGGISSFATHEDENALYIYLNTSKGGIRATDAAQWDKIAESISTSAAENVFVLSDNSLFGSSDFENGVVKDYFASVNKKVFVVTGGSRNTYTNINGVKYFTLGNEQDEALSATRIDNYKYLTFNFGEEVTFEWKNLF